MKTSELRQKLEERGYEVKSIRTFKNSFHLNVWTKDAKLRYFIGVPLESIRWIDFQSHFPKVRKP